MTAERKIKNNKKIVVGLSGGVDSLAALLLLKEQGWEPVGLSLKLVARPGEKPFKGVKRVCRRLGIPYFIIDASKEFKQEVVNYFISELKQGQTPNPCVVCNRYLKLKKLFAFAEKKGIGFVATGHYARIGKSRDSGRFELCQAKDKAKDQTYFLSLLPQKWLARLVFPLAKLTKKEVRQFIGEQGLPAGRQGLHSFLKKKQSQDFCFLAGRPLSPFLKKEIGVKRGLIIDEKNNILAKHPGFYFYTIGQRKGLNLAGGPYFVKEINARKNILTVTRNPKEIWQKDVFLRPCHFISGKALKQKLAITAKTRYRQTRTRAMLFPAKNKKIKIVFCRPKKAVAPGQFCVFYQGDKCLGAGAILPRKS